MSTTTTRRTLYQATEDAKAFRELFLKGSWQRWEFAGSIRRAKPEVADVEHVIIPRRGDVETGDGLFSLKQEVNLLWHRLQQLVKAGTVSKHIYGATGFRWGEKYRGVDFRGFNHEIFLATPENWGAILAIRTGPPDFSRRLVTQCQRYGYRQAEGYMHDRDGNVVPVFDEQKFFELCGERYVEPEARR